MLEDGLAARVDVRRPAIVRGYVSAVDSAVARAAIDRVRRDLGHLQAFALRPIGELDTRLVHEEDWAAAWKDHFPVLRLGRRLVIRPTWREHHAQADEVVISLDPGMAFGTGLHPTTRLCLAGIERWADTGRLAGTRVLDVGCGSGILAITAALMGARAVLGLDTDPLAVETTRANARLNGVGSIIEARQGSVPRPPPAIYDRVVANLVAGVLVDLAPDLAAALEPNGGRLLAGGIFHDRAPEVEAAFESAGLLVVGRASEADWLAIEAERTR